MLNSIIVSVFFALSFKVNHPEFTFRRKRGYPSRIGSLHLSNIQMCEPEPILTMDELVVEIQKAYASGQRFKTDWENCMCKSDSNISKELDEETLESTTTTVRSNATKDVDTLPDYITTTQASILEDQNVTEVASNITDLKIVHTKGLSSTMDENDDGLKYTFLDEEVEHMPKFQPRFSIIMAMIQEAQTKKGNSTDSNHDQAEAAMEAHKHNRKHGGANRTSPSKNITSSLHSFETFTEHGKRSTKTRKYKKRTETVTVEHTSMVNGTLQTNSTKRKIKLHSGDSTSGSSSEEENEFVDRRKEAQREATTSNETKRPKGHSNGKRRISKRQVSNYIPPNDQYYGQQQPTTTFNQLQHQNQAQFQQPQVAPPQLYPGQTNAPHNVQQNTAIPTEQQSLSFNPGHQYHSSSHPGHNYPTFNNQTSPYTTPYVNQQQYPPQMQQPVHPYPTHPIPPPPSLNEQQYLQHPNSLNEHPLLSQYFGTSINRKLEDDTGSEKHLLKLKHLKASRMRNNESPKKENHRSQGMKSKSVTSDKVIIDYDPSEINIFQNLTDSEQKIIANQVDRFPITVKIFLKFVGAFGCSSRTIYKEFMRRFLSTVKEMENVPKWRKIHDKYWLTRADILLEDLTDETTVTGLKKDEICNSNWTCPTFKEYLAHPELFERMQESTTGSTTEDLSTLSNDEIRSLNISFRVFQYYTKAFSCDSTWTYWKFLRRYKKSIIFQKFRPATSDTTEDRWIRRLTDLIISQNQRGENAGEHYPNIKCPPALVCPKRKEGSYQNPETKIQQNRQKQEKSNFKIQ